MKSSVEVRERQWESFATKKNCPRNHFGILWFDKLKEHNIMEYYLIGYRSYLHTEDNEILYTSTDRDKVEELKKLCEIAQLTYGDRSSLVFQYFKVLSKNEYFGIE